MSPSNGQRGAGATDEVTKVQQHLTLLRAEYVKLQSRFHALERSHAVALAGGARGSAGGETFAQRIMTAVANLFNQKRYSDLRVNLQQEEVFAHKFVLAARSDIWKNLESTDCLDWSYLDQDIGHALLKWIYTDALDFPSDVFTLELMRASKGFNLVDLLRKCEESLMCSVNASNCIRYYSTADEIEAEGLRNHCSELISANWNDFTSDDFAHMKAPLLYKMFQSKTKHPLHSAIRLRREDVVFLYLIEFSQELSTRVNAVDERDCLPLDIALSTTQDALANTLVEHRADVNQKNARGMSLLQIAISRGDEFSSLFLLDHGADPNPVTADSLDTPLHLVARNSSLEKVAEKLISTGANVNSQNKDGLAPLHLAVQSNNSPVFHILLKNLASTDVKTEEGFPPLWFALKNYSNFDEKSFARKLVDNHASTSMVCGSAGNTLLHHCALDRLEVAGLFLVHSGCECDRANANGETALHLAAAAGLQNLVEAILKGGADPNVQTMANDASDVFRQTPLHLAIIRREIGVIRAIIGRQNEGYVEESRRPNLNLKNSSDQTPLCLALSNNLHDVAMDLLRGGANVNVTNSDGLTLLHSAILEEDSEGAIFLLNNGAEIDLRTGSGETPLELSIKRHLPGVLEVLCRKGADLTTSGGKDPPLWSALAENEDIASILVRHGVDSDGWGDGPDGCQQTLLHRAIDENNEQAACFLIRSGCDLNSPRRPGLDGRGGDEARDLAAPLHLCCQWGLEATVRALLEHGADVNARDVEGKTPLHVSIENAQHSLIDLLLSSAASSGLDLSLRDKAGLSVFAASMSAKNNRAAQAILAIEPQAAELYDQRGRNFLHTAVMRNDLESVLFLISIRVNVNSRTQDANLLTPLLLAVQVGNDMIIRNLILAGASVNARNSSDHQTALHLAAEANLPSICSILLSNEVDFGALDAQGNNALHLAVKEGNFEVVKVLLTESRIDAEAFNNKGRNPLHILAVFGKDNSSAIFELFLQCMPEYPINKPDSEGNTPLLLAYTKGNGPFCRSLVKAGAVLGTLNSQGVSIFNYQVATKQLLFRLLDFLSQEPKWGEGDVCEECSTKFGITTRRHHCRHCGRLLCAKCSVKDMPIIKYNLSKPVRVCDVCADVLTIGPGLAS